jgi:sugar phosphate isomerase/epimerase
MMARFPVGEFPGGRAAAAPPARSVPDKPPLHYIRREGGASLPEGRGGGFQTVILLSIGSLRFFGLDRVFMVAKDLGFDGVEVIVDDRWDTTDAGYLRLLSERYALPIPSLHSPFSFIKPPAWGNDQVEHMRRSVKLAEDIGSELLVIHLAFFADRRYAGWVRNDLPRWQERTRVKLAVENMPHAFKILGGAGIRLGTGTFYAVDRGRLRNRLLRPFSRDCHIDNTFENLRRYRWRVLDTTHLATAGIDPVDAYEAVKDGLALIHVSNYNGREHQPLSAGVIDMRAFLDHVARDGYEGHVTLELMPDHFPDRSEVTARGILAADLALLRSCLAPRPA